MRGSSKITTDAARQAPGVAAVLTGDDVTKLSASLVVGVKAPLECWPIAVGRVRYVGEPVAVVVAADRYLAEDGLDLIEVDYEPLAAVIDPVAALEPSQPILHEALAGNFANERRFRYGDPERMFAEAEHQSRSRSATHAIPARRSKPTASLPNTTRPKIPTMCSPTSWDRSVSMR